ncbi:MAG: hypothetical protein JWM76_227 [Pseudonocardiales bacterium]|nr:hypothetical protein [Pseudonocardiales bacterium]
MPDPVDPMVAVRQYVEAFNNCDPAAMAAACADPMQILDMGERRLPQVNSVDPMVVIAAGTPLRTVGTPEGVASAPLFLASDILRNRYGTALERNQLCASVIRSGALAGRCGTSQVNCRSRCTERCSAVAAHAIVSSSRSSTARHARVACRA